MSVDGSEDWSSRLGVGDCEGRETKFVMKPPDTKGLANPLRFTDLDADDVEGSNTAVDSEGEGFENTGVTV